MFDFRTIWIQTKSVRKFNPAIREFVGSLIADKWVIQNKKKLFYNSTDKQTLDVIKVIDEKSFEKYNPDRFELLQFDIKQWIVREFFDNKPFVLEIPIVEWENLKDITKMVFQFFISKLVKEKIIDDIVYNIYRQIFSIVWIFLNTDTLKVWCGNTRNKKYIREDYRAIWYSIRSITLEEVLKAEIEQWFVNKDIWDKYREYCYTHLLREHAKFVLTNWAKQVLINWKRYNVIAASRWNGKTFLAWYIWVRWLLDSRPWFWWRNYREIKVFVPNFEVVWSQIMKYMKSFIWDLEFKRLKTGKKAFEISKNSIKCNITWNILQVVSLYKMNESKELWTWVWEWIAADLVIIDEAARLPDEFWWSLHQRAAFETQEFFIISTINRETPADHWFYRLLIDWENNVEDVASYRITIDDNEVMRFGKTEQQYKKELEKAKDELRRQGDIELYAKWYCIILDQSNIFDISRHIINVNPDKYKKEDIRILWFDLWKLDDTAWITIVNLTHMEVESSIKIKNLTYWAQLDYVKEYKQKFPNLFVIWDRSWVWEAVSEQDTEWIVDIWIKSTGSWDLKQNREYKYYTCNKWLIITTLATVVNNWIIKIPAHNTELIEQLNNFVKMKSSRWETILYKWKWKKKDDLVLSLAYAVLYMYSIIGLKNKEEISNYINEIWNNEIYSYNEYENYEEYYYNRLY